ncbi:MAG: hypothetical protein GDA41_10510 [Rhodospirillales bacterium]|nr:hypothetical protein [Rhodospirillales bacterium]
MQNAIQNDLKIHVSALFPTPVLGVRHSPSLPPGPGNSVLLWAQSAQQAVMWASRRNEVRLPGAVLPEGVTVSADPASLNAAEAWLIAVGLASPRSSQSLRRRVRWSSAPRASSGRAA